MANDDLSWAQRGAAAIPIVGDFLAGMWSTGASKTIARENRQFAHDEARIARDFSERMAATSVQRSVADYRAAGLNPALAYDRSAASPTATPASAPGADNYAESGISTALQVKQMRNALKEQQARIQNIKKDTFLKERQGNLVNTQNNEADRAWRFNAALQPFHLRLAVADALAREYMLPGAKNTADFQRRLGEISPGLSHAGQVVKILNALRR